MRFFRRATAPSQLSASLRPPAGQAAPHLQICAHTDDDLYFMTPDLLQSVRAGIPVVSVYLTTGEADGLNLASDDPARKTATPDYAGYTAARQHGIRAAYAAMVTGSRRAEWVRESLTVSEGAVAEINTLDEGRVTLIFLNLRTCVAMPDQKVLNLWSNKISELGTLRPSGSPIPARSDGRTLTRDGVITTLADLLTAYRPAVVRVMNPDPDRTRYDSSNDTVTYCDNSDHTAAALFAMAALRVHEERDREHWPVVESYSGYCNKLQPDNLSPAAAAEKFHYLAIYGGEDGHDCRKGPGECGDRPLGNRAFNRYYGQSTTHRWRGSTTWLQARGDGRLTAFAVLGGRPVMWTQDAPGSESWSGPEALGQWPAKDDARCLPRLDAVRDAQGRIHVFAVRSVIAPDPEDHRREVMHLQQSAPDDGFGTWQSLGSPHDQHNAIRRRALGMPTALVTASGHPQIVLRNFGTGLSSRTATDDGWGPWTDLHGGTLEGASAITQRNGHTEIYATTKTSMLRWHQPRPQGPLVRDYATQLARPAGTTTLVEGTDGRLIMFSRQPGTGWLIAHRQLEPGGTWNTQPELVDTTPGYGSVSATVLPGDTAVALVQRRDDGTLAISRQPLDGTPFSTEWAPCGNAPFAHTHSAALDAEARLVISTVGLDAQLHLLTVHPTDDDVSAWLIKDQSAGPAPA
ncbi:PIG-L family deacetylase [Streptomyces sp. Edi4]|uniref:PIG-L family deacetylase n=1 Tax=Streptomyces sp. Edi4 TaxID=3162527 RepID=UPI003305A2E2